MMIFACDHRGIIMTDRVPCGTSVTAATYYFDLMQNLRRKVQKLRRKVHKNRPGLLGDGPPILHDNARPHLRKVVTDFLSKYEWEVLPHAPYGPYMSPPDFELFHKLKQPMRGHHFPSLEEVTAAVTRVIRRLNKSGALNGIANLPKHWDAVIEKQGDYVEGL
jgi:histone-lysine N-methyltransferase SETMAR